MNNEQKEALDAVIKINDELSEKYSNNNEYLKPILSITIADHMLFTSLSLASVKNDLPELNLYSSEDNDRIFYDETNSYESSYYLIKRKFNEIKSEINQVSL